MDDRTRPPGIAMMIAAGIFAALTFFVAALYAALFGFAALAEPQNTSSANPDDTIAFVVMITMIIVGAIVMAVIYGLIGWGGWNLMNRRSYSFAVTGAVLCLVMGIPCSCVPINSLVFIPIGIWSMTVLMDQTIKDNWYTPSVPTYIPPAPPSFTPPSS